MWQQVSFLTQPFWQIVHLSLKTFKACKHWEHLKYLNPRMWNTEPTTQVMALRWPTKSMAVFHPSLSMICAVGPALFMAWADTRYRPSGDQFSRRTCVVPLHWNIKWTFDDQTWQLPWDSNLWQILNFFSQAAFNSIIYRLRKLVRWQRTIDCALSCTEVKKTKSLTHYNMLRTFHLYVVQELWTLNILIYSSYTSSNAKAKKMNMLTLNVLFLFINILHCRNTSWNGWVMHESCCQSQVLQTRTLLSSDWLARYLPTGSHARPLTRPVWPRSTANCSVVTTRNNSV